MKSEKVYVSNGTDCWKYDSIVAIFYPYRRYPAIGISQDNIGHNFNDTYTESSYGSLILRKIKVRYVVYDYLGRVIRKEVIKEALRTKEPYVYTRHLYVPENYLGFRNGPVPGVSNKYHFYNYYRRIKTTQERRINCAHHKYTRGKRRNLPSAWDDIARSDFTNGHSSWKNQKKRKQWM
jgi:hypothetical protein